jgi:hypothetical protein
MAGNAQAAAHEAEAQAARQNARLAELAGIETLRKSAREEKQFREEARQFQSSQRTAIAASGTQLSGSPLSVLTDTALGIEQDAVTMRYNGLQTKWGHDVNAVNFGNQAAAARASAKNAKTAGWMNAFTGLLSTAGTVAGMTPKSSTGSSVKGGTITVGGGTQMWGGYDPSELAFLREQSRGMNPWRQSYGRARKSWGF